MRAMHRNSLRTLALLLMLAFLVSSASVAGSGTSLAADIAYYEVSSSSYDQAVDIPFAVTIAARDSLHNLVKDKPSTLSISSNSHSMVFDTNNNGIFGEDLDSTGVLSYGRLHVHARDSAPARGAIITVADTSANEGSSDAYAIHPTTVVSSDGWAWQNPLPQGNDLRGISGRSGDDIFAVGEAGTIMHYNGATWTPMLSGTTEDLYAVTTMTSSDVFAAGDGGVIHYDGVGWRQTLGETSLRGIWGTTPSSVFAVGDEGTVVRYDGETWTEVDSGTTSNLRGVWGSSPSEVFAVGDNGTVLRYQYGAVTLTSVTGNSNLHGVWGSSPSDVFAVGDSGIVVRYDGAEWAPMSSGTVISLRGVWGSSPSDVFAAGEGGTVLHYDGTAWTAASSSGAVVLQAVWGSPTGEVMAVGSAGVILQREGADWLPMAGGAAGNLHGIWGSSPSDVFAVGEAGTVLHYDGSAWVRMDTGTTATLSAIWGSSPSDVFVVGYSPQGGGIVLHYDGGAWSTMIDGGEWLSGVWGSSPSDVFAVGEQGKILHYDGSTWAAVSSGVATWLDDVWGTSPPDVFAVGAEGVVLHYDGNTWAAMDSGVSYWLAGVGGASPSDVYAVSGGTVLRYDSSRWSTVFSGGRSLTDVWASQPSDVFAAGEGGVFHYDGGAWTQMNSGFGGLTRAIWGHSSSDVFAVGNSGAIVHYREPAPVAVASVTPGSGELGQTLDVIVDGCNLGGATGVAFGLGVAVTVNSFTVVTPDRITASITIPTDVAPGARNVYVFTSNGEGTLYSGFTVNEAAPPPSRGGSRTWLLAVWVFLGMLAAGVLAGLFVRFRSRSKKAVKPPDVELRQPVKPEPEMKTEPPRAADQRARPRAEAEEPQFESISIGALKAMLDGRAIVRTKGPPAAPKTTDPAKGAPTGDATPGSEGVHSSRPERRGKQ
jgi:hypothetical protein